MTCPVLPRHRLPKSHPLPRVVSDSSTNTFFAHLESPRDKAMFLLMLECGMRVGEVHHLSMEDIFFEDPSHLIVHGKGGKKRIVYLSPPAQDALQGWLASRPVSNDRAVFISEHGKRLSVAGIQYILRGYCEKAGVKLTAHQLRHTFGSRMAEAHLPLTSLQFLLGHKDLRTTQIYVHLSNSHLHDEYDRAVSQFIPASSSTSSIKKIERKYFPKKKRVNWRGYLSNLPTWLAKSLHIYCSQHCQAQDSVQHTRNVLSQLTQFSRWMLSNTSISDVSKITPKLWFAYVEIRLESGIKPTSLNTTLRILQSFLKSVHESGHTICERLLEVRPLKTREPLPRVITEVQLNQLLNLTNPFDYAWILLMAHSGLRTCEIRNLCWQDVDLQRHTIHIEESKGLHSRVVFLSPSTLDALKGLSKDSAYVFTYNNQPLSNRYCQSRLKTLGNKYGVQVTPHQLRRTCATMLLNAGMSIFGVQAILGHKYIDTTLRYARSYDATIAKDYRKAIEACNNTPAPMHHCSKP